MNELLMKYLVKQKLSVKSQPTDSSKTRTYKDKRKMHWNSYIVSGEHLWTLFVDLGYSSIIYKHNPLREFSLPISNKYTLAPKCIQEGHVEEEKKQSSPTQKCIRSEGCKWRMLSCAPFPLFFGFFFFFNTRRKTRSLCAVCSSLVNLEIHKAGVTRLEFTGPKIIGSKVFREPLRVESYWPRLRCLNEFQG